MSQPAQPREGGPWWLWPNVVEGFQLAVQRRINDTSVEPRIEADRGIVIVGGGPYLPSVYVSVRVIRKLGCNLPIEVWHFDGEIDEAIGNEISAYDVTFVNADRLRETAPFRFLDWHWWKGWQLKSYALLNSRFREVLLLDADCFPVKEPNYLFEWRGFRDHGAVIWPDLKTSPTKINTANCNLFEIDPPTGRLAESGQLMVDRERCWKQLRLAGFYNEAADISYRYIWGDKDTFPFAWQRTGTPYGRMWPESHFQSHCILQRDYRGHVIFQHRVNDKFKLEDSHYDSTPQPSTENRYHPGLAHEAFSFQVLDELSKKINGRSATTLSSEKRGNPKSKPGCITQMYPPVSVDTLCSEDLQDAFQEAFIESGELTCDPYEYDIDRLRPHTRCISASLFKCHPDNTSENESDVDDAKWREKYWQALHARVAELRSWPDWKLRLYVEPKLWRDACESFGNHQQIELLRMRNNTIGASPGALWRFLAFDDRSLETVLVADIDEPLRRKKLIVSSFTHDDRSVLGRLGGFYCNNGYRVSSGRNDAKNYATILASRIVACPARFDVDMKSTMRGFMAYRRQDAMSERRWAYSKEELPTPYNRPIGKHAFGWGSHWYMYCFDERFLKHVLYYHFADRGQLHTWSPCAAKHPKSHEGELDFAYVVERGNTVVHAR